MIRDFFTKNIITPVVALLRQRLTPQMLALSMASGIIIGTFPIVGTTTAICTMAAIIFRMNLLVAQLGNWLVYPIQLLLIVPFIIMGEHLFGSHIALDPSSIATLLRTDMWTSVHTMSNMVLHAAAAWALFAPIGFAAVYAALNFAFKLLNSRMIKNQ